MSVPVRVADLGPAAHGVFTTAHGGVSRAPWAAAVPAAATGSGSATGGDADGLNLGPHVGDDPSRVRTNRERVASLVGAPVAWMTQVHGTTVAAVTGRTEPVESVGEADVLLALPGEGDVVAVGVMVADCVPLLLADAAGRAAAAVHVGRAGLVADAVGTAVRALAHAGVDPSELSAHLGPSICGSCYEVPARLQRQVLSAHPAAEAITHDGTPGLDVAAAVEAALLASGVGRVSRDGACTYEDRRLYSYRRATHAGEPRTGRFAGIVTLGP